MNKEVPADLRCLGLGVSFMGSLTQYHLQAQWTALEEKVSTLES